MRKIIIICIALVAFIGMSYAQQTDERGYIVKVGDMAPNFKIKLTDGKTAQLSDLKGKIVMLQFTASWCGVCRKE